MPPRLPELVKRARRLAHGRDRLVQELAREWTTALRGQGFSPRDLDELWAGLTEEAVRRLLQTDARAAGARGHPARGARESSPGCGARGDRACRGRIRSRRCCATLPPWTPSSRAWNRAGLAGIPRRRLTEATREVLAAERRRVLEARRAAAATPTRSADACDRRALRARPVLARPRRSTPPAWCSTRTSAAPCSRRWPASGSQAVAAGVLEPRDGRAPARSAARATPTWMASSADSPAPRPRSWSTTAPPPCCSRLESARPRQGGRRLARRADRDRRRVPHPRHHAARRARRCARSARPTARTSRTTPRPSDPRRGCSSRSTPPTTAWSASPPRCRSRELAELGASAACR